MEQTPAHRGAVVRILFLGVLVTALDIAVLAPALRSIGAYFGVDERTTIWAFIIFSLFTQLGIPFTSRLSDLRGRRFSFSWSMGLFFVGAAIVVFSRSFGILLLGRAIQGFGASGVLPVASALIGDLYPVRKRGRMLGVIGAVFGIAFILGPLLSSWLIQYGWQWLFVLSMPFAALVWGLSLRFFPSNRNPQVTRLDVYGVLLLGLSMAALTIGINRLDTVNLGGSLASFAVWPFLIAGAAFLVAFFMVEKKSAEPYLRLELFSSRQVVIACIVSMGAGMSEAIFVVLPSFAVASYGVTDRTASIMLMPLVLALAIGSPLTGRLLDRIGSRWIVVGGTLFVSLGLFLLGEAPGRALYAAALASIGLGLAALLGSALSYILLNEARQTERTVAQGLIRLFKAFGRLLGGAFIGAVVASAILDIDGYASAFFAIGCFMGLMHLLSYALQSKDREASRHNPGQ